MHSLLRRISCGLDRIEPLLTAATGVILGALVVLVAWQVVARYVFDTGLFWADELTSVAVMWAALLGAAGCVWTDSNMRLNLVIDRLPAAGRVWCLSLMDAVVAWFAAVFFTQGVSLVQRTMSGRMASLDIPVGATYLIVPVSAALMAVFGIVRGLNRLAGHYGGRQEGER
jgi:TRAP-type C4-dicarboxylate transport system permease small subunit